MKHICEFHIKPRGVFKGKVAYDAQATVYDESGENRVYVFADRWGSERGYTVAKCSQMEDDLQTVEFSEEEAQETEASISYAAELIKLGMSKAAEEVLTGPECPMIIESYSYEQEAMSSRYADIFRQLDAVIDMMETYRIDG